MSRGLGQTQLAILAALQAQPLPEDGLGEQFLTIDDLSRAVSRSSRQIHTAVRTLEQRELVAITHISLRNREDGMPVFGLAVWSYAIHEEYEHRWSHVKLAYRVMPHNALLLMNAVTRQPLSEPFDVYAWTRRELGPGSR